MALKSRRPFGNCAPPPPYYGSAMSGSPRPTSPAYLRTLASKYDATAADVTAPPLKRQAARRHASRLLEIAAELDHLYAGAKSAATPPHNLAAGTDTALARLRVAAATPAPTLEELAALREEVRRG